MTAPGAWAPSTRASQAVVRWVRAAGIALLAALAVLIHHESAAVALGPAWSSSAHLTTPGMVMAHGHAVPATAMTGHGYRAMAMNGHGETAMTGHGHGSAVAQAADQATAAAPTMFSADGPGCDGMAMQHCSAASLEVVKLAPPAQTPASRDLAAHEVVTSWGKAAGTVGRAPPDLSVLSRLRM